MRHKAKFRNYDTFRYLKTLIFNNFFKILHFMFLFLTSIICRVFYTGGGGMGMGKEPHTNRKFAHLSHMEKSPLPLNT